MIVEDVVHYTHLKTTFTVLLQEELKLEIYNSLIEYPDLGDFLFILFDALYYIFSNLFILNKKLTFS